MEKARPPFWGLCSELTTSFGHYARGPQEFRADSSETGTRSKCTRLISHLESKQKFYREEGTVKECIKSIMCVILSKGRLISISYFLEMVR